MIFEYSLFFVILRFLRLHIILFTLLKIEMGIRGYTVVYSRIVVHLESIRQRKKVEKCIYISTRRTPLNTPLRTSTFTLIRMQRRTQYTFTRYGPQTL